ncbi:MAG: YraN family protein [Bacteroidales bacterium]
MSESYDLGKEGELRAINYLKENGYIILDVNWRFSRFEIDIICVKDNEIIFIEVKTHSGSQVFNVNRVVNLEKQRHIIFAADKYVKYRKIDLFARFDIIVVIKIDDFFVIDHYPNAFTM